jgi:hypothetical protein
MRRMVPVGAYLRKGWTGLISEPCADHQHERRADGSRDPSSLTQTPRSDSITP